MELNKKSTENEREYIWRICSAKDYGTLDADWDEVARILNHGLFDDDYDAYLSPSAFRKPYQEARKYYEDVFSKQESNEYTNDLSDKLYELEKKKKQIQAEKVEYNKWLREDARDELILEKIINAVRDTSTLPPVPKIENAQSVENEKSHILLFGDAHFGAEFKIQGICNEIINEYSPEIFYSRMQQLLIDAVHFIKRNDIDTLYVFDLGDDIDGILRVSQLFKLRYGVVESTIKYAKFMAGWLNELGKYVKVKFRMINGNHSELRMLNQPKGTFVNDNMGFIVNEIINIILEGNPNVEIKNCPNGIIYENIQGFNVVGYHGEDKKLDKVIKDYSQIYGVNIDILIGAHLHHSYSENVGFSTDIMRIPSIIGVDDFSLKLLKTSDPGATIITIEKNKGKINDYHIKLGGVKGD